MEVRRIEKKDRFESFLISTYCFHSRIENVEEKRETVEKNQDEDWGAFTDNGTMAAHVINNHLELYLDGKIIPCGGIGAVSTLPEYRNSGAVKQIMHKLLPEAYRRGEVLSALYPFKHAFYRKFGYEVVTFLNEYEFEPSVLSDYHLDFECRRWQNEDSTETLAAIYDSFARRYNLAMPRDQEKQRSHFTVEKTYQDRQFTYLLSVNGKDVAYIKFKDVFDPKAAILETQECAWISREGFLAILSFLARFEADYGKIRLILPKGVDLLRIIKSSKAYDIKKETRQDFMVRVMNVKKALQTIKKPVDCDFTVKVKDEILAENNGVWHVTGSDVVKLSEDICPDLSVNIRTFSQLIVGALTMEETELQPDVRINKNKEMLSRVFMEKPIYVGEHF